MGTEDAALQFAVLGLGVPGNPFEPQPESLPVDGGDHLQGHQRVPEAQAKDFPIGERPLGSRQGGDQQVALTWTAPTNTGGSPLTDYIVQFSTNSGSTWSTFADGTSTTASATVA